MLAACSRCPFSRHYYLSDLSNLEPLWREFCLEVVRRYRGANVRWWLYVVAARICRLDESVRTSNHAYLTTRARDRILSSVGSSANNYREGARRETGGETRTNVTRKHVISRWGENPKVVYMRVRDLCRRQPPATVLSVGGPGHRHTDKEE